MDSAVIPPAKNDKGLVIVLTGNGKGKTTAAFGQALRAIGHGAKVMVVQFMKGRKCGEHMAAEAFLPALTIHLSDVEGFVRRRKPTPIDMEMARRTFTLAKQAITEGLHEMIILDEINVAINFGLISLEETVGLIRNKPPGMHIILTGRYAPQELIDLADTVSEIKDVKHHYDAGIKDLAGIEY